MKRDLSLIREILIRCESAEAGSPPTVDELLDLCSNKAQLEEHIGLMAEADLIHVIDVSDLQEESYLIQKLTWSGHEFLDSVRDDGLWKKAKEHVIKPGASWTFGLLGEWLKNEAKQRLGIGA